MHRLAHGPYIARIDDRGATLAELTHNGRNLILPAPEGTPGSAATDPLYRGALLAPWPNRVADGTYRFKGTQYELPITEPDRHHAIHGLIHALLFAADPPELTPGSSPGSAPAPPRAPASDRADAAGEHLTLRATLEPSPGYPWRLAVTVSYRLDDDGLSTEISAQNLSESEAPFGVGAHPYLVAGDGRADDWSLELDASARLEVDPERLIPTTLHPSEPFTGEEPLGTTALDHAFTELASAQTSAASTRTVQASTASTRTASTNAAPAGGDALQPVRLTAPDGSGVEVALGHGVRWVQVFTTDLGEDHPLTRRAVAVEPMSCSADAFNAADHAFDTGLVALAPDVSWSMSWRIAALDRPTSQ